MLVYWLLGPEWRITGSGFMVSSALFSATSTKSDVIRSPDTASDRTPVNLDSNPDRFAEPLQSFV
jgi:hypothetical protein